MGNHVSRQAQLELETKNIFDRLMNKTTIVKSDILSLTRKFKDLKEVNENQYTTITNKANRLASKFKDRSLKGRINPKEWEQLQKVYEEFEEMITVGV